MMYILKKKTTINISLLEAMEKEKYPDLSGSGDNGSELALNLGDKEHHRSELGFMRSDEK